MRCTYLTSKTKHLRICFVHYRTGTQTVPRIRDVATLERMLSRAELLICGNNLPDCVGFTSIIYPPLKVLLGI